MTSEYQLNLAPRTLDDADARSVLEKAQAQVGFVPNMYGLMANSPGLLETYVDGYARFRRHSGFTPPEQEVVFLIISRYHGCGYCVAAHSMIADKISKTPPAVTRAIRDWGVIKDPKLDALAFFTESMVALRGRPSREDVEAFLAVGYQERHILEIILAIAVKTLSNFSNHLFHTPLDPMFARHDWNASA